ncbi:hypothetical protein ACHAXA_006477 [Cyclostephanos tholiformis]|uniref:Uncharacterized protein n=1 Tax=Cyclostephanos tholiformis TaxID=382380 RepID=A0ABD3RZK0_9STRA
MPSKHRFLLATWTFSGIGTSSSFIKPPGIPIRTVSPPRPLLLLYSSSSESPNKRGHKRRGASEARGDECLLIPVANPNFDSNATSLSGVPYARVISGIDALYPPYELSNRNAISRTDGYWKYVARGELPQSEFTYGEFDIDFFGILLDKSWEHYLDGMSDRGRQHEGSELSPWKNKTFCDIGSGAGRLVLCAAALHPAWKLCRGLEILDGLHNMSKSIADRCVVNDDEECGVIDGDSRHVLRILPANSDAIPCASEHLPLAPIELTCGSFTNPYEYLGDIDCAFVFSSCMKPDLVEELSVAIGRQCKPGTIIITTEFPLYLKGNIEPLADDESMPHGHYELQLLEKINGFCWLLGGESTAYIHRVITSLWEEYSGPRKPPQSSLEEEAFKLVQLMEKGELTDTNAFLRRVRNDMIFHDLPQEFLPDIE